MALVKYPPRVNVREGEAVDLASLEAAIGPYLRVFELDQLVDFSTLPTDSPLRVEPSVIGLALMMTLSEVLMVTRRRRNQEVRVDFSLAKSTLRAVVSFDALHRAELEVFGLPGLAWWLARARVQLRAQGDPHLVESLELCFPTSEEPTNGVPSSSDSR